MKVLFLFNRVRTGTRDLADIAAGDSHDNQLFGMLRLRARGIETNFLELEQFLPGSICRLLRRYVLNMHWVHAPLLPLFFRYDAIFTSTAYGSLFLYACLKAIFRFSSPRWVMLDFNLRNTAGKCQTLKQKLFAWALKHVDGVVAISEVEAQAMREFMPHLSNKIIFIHEAVDTDFFKPSGEREEEPALILSVGRDPSRDFDTLVAATRDLPVRVVLATKPERVAHLQPLPAHIQQQSFPPSEMRQIFARAAVVVVGLHVKDQEGADSMGTFSVLEAMSMGKAVVVTHSRSMESYVADGVTGRFVPVQDVEGLHRVLQELLRDVPQRVSLGRAAREFVLQHGESEQFADTLTGYLGSLVHPARL